jgi:hypothetical protein
VSLTGTSLWMFHVLQTRTPRLTTDSPERGKKSEAAKLLRVLQTAQRCSVLLRKLPAADRSGGTEVT